MTFLGASFKVRYFELFFLGPSKCSFCRLSVAEIGNFGLPLGQWPTLGGGEGLRLPPILVRTKIFCLKKKEISNAFFLKQ